MAKKKIQVKTAPKKLAKKDKKRRPRLDFDDLVFSFQGTDVSWESDDLSKRENDLVVSAMASLFSGFSVDKSYVAFDGNLHGDVYLELADWQWICMVAQIPKDSRTDFQNFCLREAYEMVVLGYAYRMLENFEIYADRIELSLGSSPYIVEIHRDRSGEWRKYSEAAALMVEEMEAEAYADALREASGEKEKGEDAGSSPG